MISSQFNGINLPSASNAALGDFAFVVGAAAAGAFIGASMTPILVGRMGTRRWSAATLLIGGIASAALMAITIAAPESTIAVYTLMGCGLFLGWTGQCVKVCSDSITQDAVEDDHRGRVFSIYDMAVNVGLVSGIIAAAEFLAPDGRSLWAIGYIVLVLAAGTSLLRVPRK